MTVSANMHASKTAQSAMTLAQLSCSHPPLHCGAGRGCRRLQQGDARKPHRATGGHAADHLQRGRP